MEANALERARARVAAAIEGRPSPAEAKAALDQARSGVEALAEATAAIPEAVREGVRSEAAPVARQLAEVRGLANQTIRRLERIETDLAAERHARVDDLALLVDLIEAGWKAVADQLARLEAIARGEAPVYHLEERRSAS
jgi:hypothetical protein